jgi:hypothetical protein
VGNPQLKQQAKLHYFILFKAGRFNLLYFPELLPAYFDQIMLACSLIAIFSTNDVSAMTKPLPKHLNLYALAFVATLAANGKTFAQTEEIMMPSDPPKFAQARHSEPLPLPRDPDIAVQEEFDAARARATIEAWELFLARHSAHRLAAEARKELENIKKSAR